MEKKKEESTGPEFLHTFRSINLRLLSEKGKSKSPGASKPPALNSSASSSASASAMGASPSLVNGGARFLHSECSTQFLTGFGAFSGPGALT